jgi:ADP-heptose:LPS heptosyltransferase
LKILVIRFSSIGDIILTSAVIRCIKKQHPEAEIHYLTKQKFSALLAANPYIQRIHCLKESLFETIKEVRSEDFDFIVDLHHNLRTAIVKLALGKSSATFNKLNWQKWLFVNFKINLLPDIHIVDRYFNAVKKLNVSNDKLGLDFFIPEKDKVNMESLPEVFRKGFIAIVVGGKHFTKQLPDKMLIELCNKLKKPLILLGGAEDEEKASCILKQCTNPDVFNAVGKFNINQTASVIAQSDKILTADTGMMHIAAAFKKDITSVWGNTVPEFGMYPYLPETEKEKSHIIEIKGLKCRPCSKIGFDACPKKHFNCMMQIDINLLLNHLQ